MAAVTNATASESLDAFPATDTTKNSTSTTTNNDEESETPTDCDCDGLGGFPCWPCVKTGRKELPN